MNPIRLALALAISTAACSDITDSGDDAASCFEGKCDGFGGADQLAALSQTVRNPDGQPSGFATLGTRSLFFSATKHGLWITDGTAAGTHLVRDLEPLVDSMYSVPKLATLGSKAYWSTRNSVWMTDGTPGGTERLIEIPGNTSTYVTDVVAFGGSLVFGTESALYVSDGTVAGTRVLSMMGVSSSFAELGGKLYFSCYTAATGGELCVTDKTAAGTRLVKDIWPGSDGAAPVFLGVTGTKLLFSAVERNNLLVRSLWSTDGTSAGTIRLIAAGTNSDVVSQYTESVSLGGTLYFPCSTSAAGLELCKSDGTLSGTAVLDVTPGTASLAPHALSVIGSKLVFTARTQAAGQELWASDGTVAGTAMIVDVYPGTNDGVPQTRFVRLGNQLVFAAKGPGLKTQLWGTDGTAAGTHLISDVGGANPLFDLTEAKALGSKLLFAAADGVHGTEPWVTDGTASGTMLLEDTAPPTTDLDAYEGATFGTGSYFHIADRATQGGAIWRTDGTAAGTMLWQQVSHSTLPDFTAVGSTLYYRTSSELWKTNGQGAGSKVADLPGAIEEMTALGNTLAFTGTLPDGLTGLWLSDGTATGTVATPTANARYLRAANGRLWFQAESGGGNDLWTSDGTVGGTRPVVSIHPNGTSYASGFIAFGGKTLFAASDVAGGSELWVTQGTAQTTHQLADIAPGSTGSGPHGMTALNATTVLFWASPSATSGRELWRTDGTAANTVRVKAVGWGDAMTFVVWGNYAFFSGKDGAGNELWRTDGTEAGTVRVADIYPGALSASPRELVLASPNGPLYFSAEEPVGGRELWMLDSPTGAPARAADISPGPRSSNPSLLQTRGASTLLFVADGGHGMALFRLGEPPDVTAPKLSCPADLTVEAKDASGAIVTFPLPSATDNKGTPTVTTMPASGGTFMVGDTTVTATAVDGAANTASCTFVVHVTYDGHGGGVDGEPDGEPDSGDEGGCSAGGGSAGTFGLVIAAMACRRRRKR